VKRSDDISAITTQCRTVTDGQKEYRDTSHVCNVLHGKIVVVKISKKLIFIKGFTFQLNCIN